MNEYSKGVDLLLDTQIIVYKKSDLDKIVDLLDSLTFQGNIVRNSQVVTAIVQILQTQGTVQSLTNEAHDTEEKDVNHAS